MYQRCQIHVYEYVNITSLHTNDYGWSAIFPQQQFGQPCSTAYLMISDCHLSLGGKQPGYRGELQVTLQEIVQLHFGKLLSDVSGNHLVIFREIV